MQGILQVAIGLIFVYSLLSILVTTVNTVLTNLLKWRAKHLKYALESLITDPEVQAQFLSHPLINIVKTQMVKPNEVETTAEAEAVAGGVRNADVNTVNWIDPTTFAQVLQSILAEKAGFELYGPLLLAVDALPDGPARLHLLDLVYSLQNTGIGVAELRAEILKVPAEMQPALLTGLKPIEDRNAAARLSSDDGSRLLPVLDGLRRVNDDAFRRALKVIVASAKSVDEAQEHLESWFNQRMDQLSDSYKRNVTYLTLAIGLLLAIIINADSLQMARALWEDSSLRDAASVIAAQAVNSGQLAPATPTPSASIENTPEPGVIDAGAAAAAEPSNSDIADAAAQALAALNQLTSLNLPIGWEYTPLEVNCTPQADKLAPVECGSMRNLWLLAPGNNPDWLGLLIRKLIGVAVTVIAIGQGAPFWFDLIRRLVKPGT